MNLLLLHPEDLVSVPNGPEDEIRARIGGRRFEHVHRVHRAEVGDELRVGVLGGALGRGRVIALSDGQLDLAIRLDRQPPPASPVTLVLALPRPPVLKRVLIHATSLGVKRIALIHARRVEKSYWQSEAVSGETLRDQLLLGLEQAGDTVLPTLSLHRRFRAFVEDVLPALRGGSRGFVAHPEAEAACPRQVTGPITVVLGPEGGFIAYEVDKLVEAGLEPVRFGDRILRIEAAVPWVIARVG